MTGVRFLAFVRHAKRDGEVSEPLGPMFRKLSPRMQLATHGRTTIAVCGEPVVEFAGGIAIGALFDRRAPHLVRKVDEAEAQRIVGSGGRHLTERYWGSYVAVLWGSESAIAVVRAPFGELPCYQLDLDGGTVCASDVGLLTEAGFLRAQLAWDAVIRELAWRDVRGRETCLSGVRGLRGGDRLVIADQGSRVDTLWSPWDVDSADNDCSTSEISDRLRREVMACIAARTSVFDHVLLLLSGGLDSSIVAASLANGRTPFSLATFTTRDPLGDEREYAEAVADTVRHPLHEAMREVGRIDPDRSTAARMPRPSGRLFEQESARIASEIAARVGARAIVTGGGGDNVFCSLQSAAPVADRLLAEGPGRGTFETAREIGRFASASLPAVVWAALRRLSPRDRHIPLEPDLSFLTANARDAVGVPPHAWLSAPQGALPGRAAHIKLLAAAESFMQGFDPKADLPVIAPLLAQPVVETCLSVPSWCWFAGGLNRAVARRAFAGDLPDRIIRRGSKGSPDSFAAEIYERYRPALRESLLGGVLVAERILDPGAIEASFARAGVLVPAEYRRLLRLADVESWARAWVARAG